MKLTLSCPFASYDDGMRINCSRTGARCGHAYFKRCKGWWVLTGQADRCPLRKEESHAND